MAECELCALPRLLLRGALVVRSRDEPPLSPGYVLVGADGRVRSVGSDPPDTAEYDEMLEAQVVAPGLIDIHNHGVGGGDQSSTSSVIDVTYQYKYPEYTLKRLPLVTSACPPTVDKTSREVRKKTSRGVSRE